MEPLQKFGPFIISRKADGAIVELRRSPADVAFLAFDTQIKRLVELHVLTATASLSPADRAAIVGRCKAAAEVRSPSCMRVLEAGEEDETVYFSSGLSDGELVEDYIARRGALPQVTVFCLVQQLLEDLIATPDIGRLLPCISLANPVVTTQEDSFLQLRIVDYSLGGPEGSAAMGARRVVSECCQLLFLLLTGEPFDFQNPDQIPALTCLPTNLRTHLRTVLMDPYQAGPHLEKLRDDVREAYAALVSNLQIRTSRRHIVVTEALQPRSRLKDLLLDQLPLEELLNGRFEIASGEDTARHPFTISAVNLKTEQPVTIHLLPASGIVPRDQYEAVPLQMWRFNPDRHPNILRSLSVWENPAWTFLTEEREPGFSLGRLMAARITLNPPEVLAILRQVLAGLEQAMECGVRSADLHPSNLLLRVGKGGALQAREFERLMEKRIDAWPPFQVKLRTHMTMRGLYEPPLSESEENQGSFHMAERDLRHRTFLSLAIYLLTGERKAGKTPDFGEAVSPSLANYLRGCLLHPVAPSDFVAAFEQHMGQPATEGRGIAAIMAAGGTPPEEMEDAGAISDFDEDWSDAAEEASPSVAAPNYLLTGNATRKSFSVSTLPQQRPSVPGRAGMFVWAGAAMMFLVVCRFALFGGSSGSSAAPAAVPPPLPQAAAAQVHASTTPALAGHFSSAPDVAAHEPGAGAKTPKPAVQTSPPASSKPAGSPPTVASSPPEKPAPAPVPPAKPPVVASSPPGAAGTASPAPFKPAVHESVATDHLPAATQPRQDVPEPPVIIKKAIVPSAKEVGEARKEPSPSGPVSMDKTPSVDVVEGGGVGRFR